MPTLQQLDTSKIVQVKFPETQYYKEVFTKNQVVIHHTVSSGNATNVFSGWASNPERVATPFVIAGNGIIHQGFSSKHWAHHLGTKEQNNTALNKASVGIEVCNWGGLTKKDGKYYSAFNSEVPAADVIDYGQKWHGYQYFHKYSPAQIESLRQLIVYLCDTYQIPKTYFPEMWELNKKALAGEKGVFTHVSYRTDKSDMHPQPELIAMLKNL